MVYNMFKVISNKIYDNYKVVYQEDTKVMYTISDTGVVTLLVNPDGSPMVYRGGSVDNIKVVTEVADEYFRDFYIYKEGNFSGDESLTISEVIALLEEAKRLKGSKVIVKSGNAPVTHICLEGDCVKIYTGAV